MFKQPNWIDALNFSKLVSQVIQKVKVTLSLFYKISQDFRLINVCKTEVASNKKYLMKMKYLLPLAEFLIYGSCTHQRIKAFDEQLN